MIGKVKVLFMKKTSKSILAFILALGLIFAMMPETVSAASITSKSVSKSSKVIKIAKKKIGCRYRSGARGPRYFDCTGFVYYCMRKSGVKVKSGRLAPYKSSKYNVGKSIKKAQKGDILLYYRGGRVGHAAIYMGKGKVIHATSHGVRITRWNGFGQKLAAVIRVYSPEVETASDSSGQTPSVSTAPAASGSSTSTTTGAAE